MMLSAPFFALSSPGGLTLTNVARWLVMAQEIETVDWKRKMTQLKLSHFSFGIRQCPTLPGRHQPSTIGAERLNFCVRYGNRWIPFAITTGMP